MPDWRRNALIALPHDWKGKVDQQSCELVSNGGGLSVHEYKEKLWVS